jgi:hypothetical protein
MSDKTNVLRKYKIVFLGDQSGMYSPAGAAAAAGRAAC